MGSSGLGLRSSSFRLWLRVILLGAVLALACSARNVNSIPPSTDGRLMMEERSLRVRTDDYDPSANPGHNPRPPGSGGKKSLGPPKWD